MKHFLIGAALVALASSPLAAQGKGHGNGNGGGHGNAGHGHAMQAAGHGNSGHASGSIVPAMRAAAPAHGNGHGRHAAARPSAPAHGSGHGHANPRKAAPNPSAAHNAAAHGRSAMAHASPGRPQAAAVGKGPPGPGVKVLQDGRHYYTARNSAQVFDFAAARRGLIDGCPPGLAKKYNGCQPPGLAKQRTYQPDWWGLRSIDTGPYVYDDGYLLRLGGGGVASYLPLLGGALSIGNVWPSAYAPLPVPQYYADYYDLGPPAGYRYADDVIYRVDPTTSAINSIAALLTGDTFQIGSPMPDGYDVYNVPYSYRSQYVDGPSARYRYSDGYIYQIDPATQLITAAIDLLAAR